MLIQLDKLSLKYGTRVILDELTCTLGENEKIAVIGRNGAGKSSLCKVITGEETPNSGTVRMHKNCHLSYLEQKDPYDPDDVVIDFLVAYSGKQEWECGKMAASLGLNQDFLWLPISALSGGYQMRVKLTAMVLKDPNFLILDEPTNYLDLSTLLFLEKFLQSFKGSILVVSHDREFLKKTCNYTLEVENGKAVLHKEGIEEYFEFKAEQLRNVEQYNKNILNKKKHLQSFVDRFGSKASKASAAQSRVKQIAKLKTIDVAHPMSSVRIKMPKVQERKGVALEIRDLKIGYPDKEVAKNIVLEVDHGSHVAVLGDNGQGKSTFLKTITGELEALGGEFKWGYGLSVGYYAQHVYQKLSESDSVYEALASMADPQVLRQQILDMAGSFLFSGPDVDKKVKMLSGGERARLCLAGLLLSKADVLLLDEPTNHLDFETVEALADALKTYEGTVFFISHDRTFVNTIATKIIEVREGNVRLYGGTYEEYVYHIQKRNDESEGIVDTAEKAKPASAPSKKKKVSLGG